MLVPSRETTRTISYCFLVVATCCGTASANERLTHSVTRNIETWRIDEPEVKQAQTTYPSVLFQGGDRFTIDAGGCVQTGGVGLTWKRYVDPQGPNSDHLYHGLIQIPLATQGIQRIQDVIGRVLQLPTDTAGMVQLTLGYEDDDYGDNGYWSHDDGTGNQCKGVEPAWVVVTIMRCSNEKLAAELKTGPLWPNYGNVDRSHSPTKTRTARVVVDRARTLLALGNLDREPEVDIRRRANESARMRVLALADGNPHRLSGHVAFGAVSVNLRTGGAVELESVGSHVGVRIALDGASNTPAKNVDGQFVNVGGYRGTADIIQRPTDQGIEDYLLFNSAPATSAVTYLLWIDHTVAGLRLMSNALELLDASGVPRIRMARPYLIDSAGNVTFANLSVSGCAVDSNPVPPWGRATTKPGATTCAVHIAWSGNLLKYPAILDPSWTTTESMSTQRDRHSMVLVPGPGALVIGGVLGGGSPTVSELYSPVWSAWTFTGEMQVPRYRHSTTLLPDGRVLVTGGSFRYSPYALEATAEIYDPVKGSWTKTENMHSPRSGHQASLLNDGRVLVTGGAEEINGGESKSTEIWDMKTGQWTLSTPMNEGRAEHSATVLKDGRVLVAGGYTPSPYFPLRSSELFDPVTGIWTLGGGSQFPGTPVPAQLTLPRAKHNAALLPDGRVLVAGGENTDVVASAEIFDPKPPIGFAGWSPAGQFSIGGFDMAEATSSDGLVFLIGGDAGRGLGGRYFVDVFNPATGSFSSFKDLPYSPIRPVALFLPDGRLFVVGGRVDGMPSSEAVLFGQGLLATDRTAYVTGEPIQVLYSIDNGGASNYVSVAVDSKDSIKEQDKVQTNGGSSGSLRFTVQRPGTYRARLYQQLPKTTPKLLGESAPFVVGTLTRATVSANKSSYARGEKITLIFSGMTGRLSESIGIAQARTSPALPIARRYTMGVQSGALVFETLLPGKYVAYAYMFDRRSARAESAIFTVTK